MDTSSIAVDASMSHAVRTDAVENHAQQLSFDEEIGLSSDVDGAVKEAQTPRAHDQSALGDREASPASHRLQTVDPVSAAWERAELPVQPASAPRAPVSDARMQTPSRSPVSLRHLPTTGFENSHCRSSSQFVLPAFQDVPQSPGLDCSLVEQIGIANERLVQYEQVCDCSVHDRADCRRCFLLTRYRSVFVWLTADRGGAARGTQC